MSVASVLVDLDRLHHTHLLVVHHVAVQHEDAGVVEKARADDDTAAFGRRGTTAVSRHGRSALPTFTSSGASRGLEPERCGDEVWLGAI